jgi:hypothetical protein
MLSECRVTGSSRDCCTLKTKAPRTPFRVMGRPSNSPPPKSAHHQPIALTPQWEWLWRANIGHGWAKKRVEFRRY